ncbi:MAG: response regulator transcription factor [Candidatus Eisenbacteria bacterium]|uniref:Response regulator transcription factor n=1 Tax=Eiseniibacteriota bacterium TaxID=2212470 RepID=A0A937X9H9_UNCEI|nr:response regulator transcription factor [Candidatus Eisenbacteria bacterium]
MAEAHILIVEDEEDILQLIEYNLLKEGFTAACARTGEEALRLARDEQPDLVLLDLMLPGIDGLEVCRTLRRQPPTAMTPIVMLTAKGEEADIVAGLELGADDYITKPFTPKVLVARIRTVLRRRAAAPVEKDSILRIHGIEIHPGRHEVLVGGKRVELTFTEFRLLQLLAGRPGWVFTRYQIVNAVRGEDYVVTDRAVDVQIVGLRKKLGEAGRYIETVRGVGYRFRD